MRIARSNRRFDWRGEWSTPETIRERLEPVSALWPTAEAYIRTTTLTSAPHQSPRPLVVHGRINHQQGGGETARLDPNPPSLEADVIICICINTRRDSRRRSCSSAWVLYMSCNWSWVTNWVVFGFKVDLHLMFTETRASLSITSSSVGVQA